MPVFDFNATPDEKKPAECTYTVIRSNENEATIEKPIGLVYIAIYLNGKTIVKKCNFSGDRNEVRTLATNYAINMMIKELKDNNYE